MRELSLHVLDALENAVEAGASRVEVLIEEDPAADRLVIELADNGRGMSPELTRRVLDPFVTTRTTRHVGLGLPLFAAAAQRCEGDLRLESEPGRGTVLKATFRLGHIDRAPLGDMPGTILVILCSSARPVDVKYMHRFGGEEFIFDSAGVRQELGEVPLSEPMVRAWIQKTLREGEEGLKAD